MFIERLWRSLKYEAVYLHELCEGFEAERVIASWMRFYTLERPHSALGGAYAERGVPLGACGVKATGANEGALRGEPVAAPPKTPLMGERGSPDGFVGRVLRTGASPAGRMDETVDNASALSTASPTPLAPLAHKLHSATKPDSSICC